ncbi:hypothetical protein [Roseovarius indicus]|uniref:hypothetical protein n=1 Tax=Roseovarius indicus TaxID=540747 RepID=UPI0007D94285|nr:hypothetical protein [Roseovarius indicus]OAO06227.1 hypothetical protein A8B76_04455 [Roseovarius indicus]
MTATRQKRRVQIVCAALLHIPIVAIAAYALANGFGEHVGILSVGLVATVAATLLIVPYIGRIMDGSSVAAAG